MAAGRWGDRVRDAQWTAPGRQALYDELDRFHTAPAGDSAWGEWHYFNVLVNDDEWWYITLLVGGDFASGRGGGQVLVTRRTPRGHQRFASDVSADAVMLDTARADLTVGSSSVVQRDGSYRVRGHATGASFDLVITPAAHAYFPPIELRDDRRRSEVGAADKNAIRSRRVHLAGQPKRDLRGLLAHGAPRFRGLPQPEPLNALDFES